MDTQRLTDKDDRTIPKRFVTELGLSYTEAYMLDEMCHRQKHATLPFEGVTWFTSPVGRVHKNMPDWYRPFIDHVPWLTERALGKVLARLETKRCLRIDREFKYWSEPLQKSVNQYGVHGYHVKEHVMKIWEAAKPEDKEKRKSKDVYFFSFADAVKYQSVERAVVLNILYRSFKNTGYGDGEDIPAPLDRPALAEATGLTERAIKYALSYFVKHEVLETVDRGRTYRLLVPNKWKYRRSKPDKNKIAKYTEKTDLVPRFNEYAESANLMPIAGANDRLGLFVFSTERETKPATRIPVRAILVVKPDGTKEIEEISLLS